jgi:tRNA(fMet)-specific endonuclease VapC
MVRYVLDTDHISLFLGNHPKTNERVIQEFANCAITIISVQEVFNGWVGQLGKITDENYRITVYSRLHVVAQFFQRIPILNYDAAASNVYDQLVRDNPNLAKRRLENDIRIAAIARSIGSTVVTRNRRDFELVPGLAIVDWSV